MSFLAFRTRGLVYDRHSINICFYNGGACSEWERRKGDWEKEGKLHNGVCDLVCIYCSGKIMQLNASKDWDEGGGRDLLVSYHLALGHLTAFLHCFCLFFSVSFTLYSHFGKSPFLDTRKRIQGYSLNFQTINLQSSPSGHNLNVETLQWALKIWKNLGHTVEKIYLIHLHRKAMRSLVRVWRWVIIAKILI